MAGFIWHFVCVLQLTNIVYCQSPDVSCNNHTAVTEASLNCFRNKGLEPISSALDISTWQVFLYSLEIICRRKANVLNAAKCGLRIESHCQSSSSFVPTEDIMDATVNHLCQNEQNINETCRLQASENVLQCVNSNQAETACIGFQSLIRCFRSQYARCGCVTAKLYSNVLLDLMTSTSCSVTTEVRQTCPDVDNNAGKAVVPPGLLAATFFTGYFITGLMRRTI